MLSSTIEAKCPLEKYLNLIFTCSGAKNQLTDLKQIFESSIEFVQVILNTHKKQSKLQEISYSLVFKWFETIVFKHATVKLKKYYQEEETPIDQQTDLIQEFRQAKKICAAKLSNLILIICNPNSTQSSSIIDSYCHVIAKRLSKLNSIIMSSIEGYGSESKLRLVKIFIKTFIIILSFQMP